MRAQLLTLAEHFGELGELRRFEGRALDRTTLAGTIEARVTSEVYLRSLDAIARFVERERARELA